MNDKARRIARMEGLSTSRPIVLETTDYGFAKSNRTQTAERRKDHRSHSVVAGAATKIEEVLCNWELVAGVCRRLVKVPTGGMKDLESPEQAARCEPQNEVGLDSGRRRVISGFCNEAEHTDAFTEFVLLTDLRPGPITREEPELQRHVGCLLQEMHARIAHWGVNGARSITAVFLATLDADGSVESRSGRYCCPSPLLDV
jgi:hypothetical protein